MPLPKLGDIVRSIETNDSGKVVKITHHEHEDWRKHVKIWVLLERQVDDDPYVFYPFELVIE